MTIQDYIDLYNKGELPYSQLNVMIEKLILNFEENNND